MPLALVMTRKATVFADLYNRWTQRAHWSSWLRRKI